MAKNFIVLIGGPILFNEWDPAHDKSWANYVTLMQKAASQGQYQLGQNEIVHWVVFEPSYRARWAEDSHVTRTEQVEAFFQDAELHYTRLGHAQSAANKGAANYVHRIKQIARGLNIQYHGIQNMLGFWNYLGSMPMWSITRVWYSGHAYQGGLMVAAAHRSGGFLSWTPTVAATHLISVQDIGRHSYLSSKFDRSTNTHSNFYGCTTAPFAQEWHNTFGVPTAGAAKKVNFKATTGRQCLRTIESMPTSVGPPGWTQFP